MERQMRYDNIQSAAFIRRPNRFIAECDVRGTTIHAHVRNTGRCRELLIPGCTVYLQENPSASRKTQYTLVSVEKSGRVVNMDSLAPNKVFREAAESGAVQLPGFDRPCTVLKPETFHGNSRFDFYLEGKEQKAYVEVKGVTLEEDGVALFPDAPTERGVKHIQELCAAAREGYLAYLVFIIQMEDIRYLSPNRRTHAAFGDAMEAAQKAGVRLLAYDCRVTPDEIHLNEWVEIRL